MFAVTVDFNKVDWQALLGDKTEKVIEKPVEPEETPVENNLKDKPAEIIVPARAQPLTKTPESAIRDPRIIKRRYKDIFA